MSKLVVRIDIPYHEFLKLYQGTAKAVIARAHDGRTVQFPARALQPFVTREGVRGEFEVEFSADHKLVGVRRREA